jgi:hypothetical protein
MFRPTATRRSHDYRGNGFGAACKITEYGGALVA